MTSPSPLARRRKSWLLGAAIAAPCLVAGAVGVSATGTLSVSVDDNTATVHSSTVAPVLTVEGDPFALEYGADREITGAHRTEFVVSNTGTASTTFDAVLVAAEGTDPAVAAATRLTATVRATTTAGNQAGQWHEYDMGMGTLAAPLSLSEAAQAWLVGRPYFETQPLLLAPGEQYTVVVTPSYDTGAAATAARQVAPGEFRVATADLTITYLGS